MMHMRWVCLWGVLLGLGWGLGASVFIFIFQFCYSFVLAWIFVCIVRIHLGKIIRIHRRGLSSLLI
jgi:hypothetical protein